MGSLVINHNTQAINTHRHLVAADKRLRTSLERLSSGERIVRAADGPATLMVSERLRAQVAAFTGAIRNSEVSVSMVQTTEAALSEINQLLIDIRRLAVHAANEGANAPQMLEADQQEIDNALDAINRISQFANFAGRKILDGSSGIGGVAVGDDLGFVKASVDTESSPEDGYAVRIQQAATRAAHTAAQPLVLSPGLELSLEESGRVVQLSPKEKDTPATFASRLQNEVEERGLNVSVSLSGDGRLHVMHNDYGSEESFTLGSNVTGVLAEHNRTPLKIQNGLDVIATIDDSPTFGVGRLINGVAGSPVEGLQLLYTGGQPANPAEPVGRVLLTQRSVRFQIGPDVGQNTRIALNSVNTGVLGRNVENKSGYRSLSDIDVRSYQGAEDAMRLADAALDELNAVRGELGAIQKNSLEANVRSLTLNREELLASESALRDADMAEEASELVRNQVILQSGLAMLAQANSTSQNVLGLLQGI